MSISLEKYKKIKNEIQNTTYYERYRNIYLTIYSFSFFANLLSVFFAFFLLNSLVKSAIIANISTNPTFLIIGSLIVILILVFIELTKRELFAKFTQEFIKTKQIFKTNVLYLLLFSLVFVFISFYTSLNGAKVFTAKDKLIETEIKTSVENKTIEINTKFNQLINELEEENSNLRKTNVDLRQYISETKNLYEIKNYNTQIESNQKLIEKNDLKINEHITKRDLSIAEYNTKIASEYINTSNENKSNISFYIGFSTIIELMILFGVYYCEVYKYRSYTGLTSKYDELLKKQKIYYLLLKLIYNEGELQQGGVIISPKKIFDLAKSKNINIQQKLINDFYAELTHIGIFETKGTRRYSKVNYNDAEVLLNKLFGDYKNYIED